VICLTVFQGVCDGLLSDSVQMCSYKIVRYSDRLKTAMLAVDMMKFADSQSQIGKRSPEPLRVDFYQHEATGKQLHMFPCFLDLSGDSRRQVRIFRGSFNESVCQALRQQPYSGELLLGVVVQLLADMAVLLGGDFQYLSLQVLAA
jgi:hypothetical protein